MINTKIRAFGLVLFIVGVLAGLVFTVMVTWSDLEAYSFGNTWRPDEVLPLDCPAIITQTETGVLDLTFESTLPQPIKLTVWTMVSAASATAMDEIHHLLPIEPGGSAPLRVTFTRENAAYDRFVFVRVAQFRYYPMPERVGVCGVWVIPVSLFNGQTWVAIFFAVAVGGILSGAFMIFKSAPIKQRTRRYYMPFILGGFVLAAMLAAFWGSWFPALFLAVLALLMMLEMFREATSG